MKTGNGPCECGSGHQLMWGIKDSVMCQGWGRVDHVHAHLPVSQRASQHYPNRGATSRLVRLHLHSHHPLPVFQDGNTWHSLLDGSMLELCRGQWIHSKLSRSICHVCLMGRAYGNALRKIPSFEKIGLSTKAFSQCCAILSSGRVSHYSENEYSWRLQDGLRWQCQLFLGVGTSAHFARPPGPQR